MLVRNIRLDAAYQLLASGAKLPMREIMFEVGLSDLKTFTEAFRERFGVTPKQASLGYGR